MRILEIRPAAGDSTGANIVTHGQIIDAIESCIHQVELLSPKNLQPELSVALRSSLSRLSSLPPLPEPAKLRLWKLSYRLWNACVDLANTAGHSDSDCVSPSFYEEHAKLRQVAADLITFAGSIPGVPSADLKSASFLQKTGVLWHGLRRFDLASACFDRAAELASKIEPASSEEDRRFLLDLNVSRAATAFESPSGRVLALALLGRSKKLVAGDPDKHRLLAEQYFSFGKQLLARDQSSEAEESIKLLNEALDLSERGIKIAESEDETAALKDLRAKTLRFMAAAHLQSEGYEDVLKCVKAMSETVGGGGDHPSLGFLAMKGYLGLGRYDEAENELMQMAENCRIPAEVCLSAVEVFMKEAAEIGVEGAKAVFMGLVERGAVCPSVAVRIVERVLVGGGPVRARLAAELASEERVVALFRENGAGKDRAVMHAILWNQGADLFRCKDYKTSSLMFEKSMLYIPYDAEGRSLRAKCFRVLCLCYLALSQCDRAQEYINEADKLEAGIVSAFLKFKVNLEKKDDDGAVAQIQSMTNCIDFDPQFLTLASHEAVACKALTVAVFALSELLNRCTSSSSSSSDMREVSILRNALVLLLRLPEREQDALVLLRRARDRMAELGAERLFGNHKDTGGRELKWFANHAWNMGMKAGKDRCYANSAEFLELASEFYCAIENGDDGMADGEEMACKSLILAVSGMLNAENESKLAMTDCDVRKALFLLDKAGKILSAILNKQFAESTIEANFVFLYTFNNFELRGRINDPSSQVQAIQSYINTKFCIAKHLLQLGLHAADGARANPEAAKLALTTCLKIDLTSPSPDYRTVALILRKLIGVSISRKGSREEAEAAAMEIYQQAHQIIVGLQGGEYPVEEVKWLSTTAWNRSGMHVKLGRVTAAQKWMKMGLHLAKLVPEMEAYAVSMIQCLAQFEKTEAGSMERGSA
ncbi:TPR repeat-containing protein ZIP4 [Nymphaea colorata]|nr:TPR repeat-containing protein ZIP4 [Nymphaea colorata]